MMNGASSASSFWAQKAEQIKTPTPPRPVAPPVQRTAHTPPVKPRMVLKGMSNGSTATVTPKKVNWADSDDDEEFIASFSAQKNPRILSLENELVQKSAQIETLEAVVATKQARVAELEDIVGEKDLHVASLEAEIEDKDAEVEKLKNDNHTQFLYVQELVGEVDEKSRRIHDLEMELDEQCARNRDLKLEPKSAPHGLSDDESASLDLDKADGKDDVTVRAVETKAPTNNDKLENTDPVMHPEASGHACRTTGSATETSQPIATSNGSPHEDAIRPSRDEVDLEDNKRFPKPSSPGSIYTLPNGSVTPSQSASNTPRRAASRHPGPTVNDSQAPKFWSPDMVKKVKPVEKPKVLKMAIDTSKFIKKVTPITTKTRESSGNGNLAKHPAKTNVIPEFNVDKDIRHMPHTARVQFRNGPKVDVVLGTTKLGTLPKYIFMQCSIKAYKHFSDHPDATSITFPMGSMDATAAEAHLQWMEEMTYQGRVYSLTLNADEKFDAKNLKICQAARVMGLNNTYVGHFTKVMCNRVRGRNSSVKFLSLICELAYPENDPIFDCLANNLVNDQLGNGPTYPKHVEELFTKYPALKEYTMRIEQSIKDSRAGDKRKGRRYRDGNQA